MLRIVAAGTLASVQDEGRQNLGDLGVPVGGAADRFSLAVANLLLGNRPRAAAIELTLDGFEAEALDETLIGLAGADLGARSRPDGARLDTNRAHRLEAGARIRFDGPTGPGMRAYLALRGGVRAPAVLGSASTLTIAGLGGLDGHGRPIAAGDVVEASEGRSTPTALSRTDVRVAPPRDEPTHQLGPQTLRLRPGPFPGARRQLLSRLLERGWRIGPASDRMGLRLAGEPQNETGFGAEPELPSFPVVWGAVQVPPSGEPIVLLCDHQTIGGYPVPAIVIRADLDRVGQLRPGDTVGFELVTERAARAAWRQRTARLELIRRVLSEPDPWADLAERAGA